MLLQVGDHLLQQTASRLRKGLRETDTLSRIGGDEFVALIPDLDGRQDAMAIASKILNELAEPFSIGPEPFRTSVSIGVAVYPGDGPNEEELIRNADLAMYQAKREGKARSAVFAPAMEEGVVDRLHQVGELRRALSVVDTPNRARRDAAINAALGVFDAERAPAAPIRAI